jgi:hypothetical protein
MVLHPRSFPVIWQHFCSLGFTTKTSIPVHWPSEQRARQECASHVHGDEINFITYDLFLFVAYCAALSIFQMKVAMIGGKKLEEIW